MIDGASAGQALFAPVSRDEVQYVELAVPVGDLVALEPTAYVRPLVAAVDRGRAAGVVIVAASGVQVFEWRMGGFAELCDYSLAAPMRRWSPDVSARWYRPVTAAALTARLARSLPARLGELASERGWTALLVGGDPRLAGAFVDSVRGIHSCPIRLSECRLEGLSTAALGVRVVRDVAAARRDYERALVARVLQGASHGEAAVLGLQRTVAALGDGRVAHLVLDSRFDGVPEQARLGLAAMNSENPPGERLVEMALAANADVSQIESSMELVHVDGVAALLR
jgi:hypothetical protein